MTSACRSADCSAPLYRCWCSRLRRSPCLRRALTRPALRRPIRRSFWRRESIALVVFTADRRGDRRPPPRDRVPPGAEWTNAPCTSPRCDVPDRARSWGLGHRRPSCRHRRCPWSGPATGIIPQVVPAHPLQDGNAPSAWAATCRPRRGAGQRRHRRPVIGGGWVWRRGRGLRAGWRVHHPPAPAPGDCRSACCRLGPGPNCARAGSSSESRDGLGCPQSLRLSSWSGRPGISSWDRSLPGRRSAG